MVSESYPVAIGKTAEIGSAGVRTAAKQGGLDG